MRILLTGASSQLGGYLLQQLRATEYDVVAWSGSRTGEIQGARLHPVDLTARDGVAAAFRLAAPHLVIHAAAVSTIAQCSRDPATARQVNSEGTAILAELSSAARARLVYVSTDLVFDGERGWYREEDAPSPSTVYGQSKFAAEQAALSSPRGAVVRVSLLFGPTLVGRPTFFDQQVAALREAKPCTLFSDEWRTPLGLSSAAEGLVAVARSDFHGLLHMGGPERMSRLEMGRRLAAFLGADPSVLAPATRASAASAEPRPRDTSLDSTRWSTLFPAQSRPHWEEALRQMRGA